MASYSEYLKEKPLFDLWKEEVQAAQDRNASADARFVRRAVHMVLAAAHTRKLNGKVDKVPVTEQEQVIVQIWLASTRLQALYSTANHFATACWEEVAGSTPIRECTPSGFSQQMCYAQVLVEKKPELLSNHTPACTALVEDMDDIMAKFLQARVHKFAKRKDHWQEWRWDVLNKDYVEGLVESSKMQREAGLSEMQSGVQKMS